MSEPTSDRVRLVAFSGSLRKGSFNTALLHTAIDLAPSDVTIEVAEIRDIPLYDEDLRTAGVPASVQRFREQIARAEGVLVATPEYNYSMPGVMKNAIDWASRPPAQPFGGKTLGIMGASSGMSGTMRAQYHLRQSAVFLDMIPMNKPEVFVRNAASLVKDGRIIDEPTRKVIGDFMIALAAWTKRMRANAQTSAKSG
jgi:chromate reductase